MYYLELNLARIAVVTLAKALWDFPEIKHQIRIFFHKPNEKEKNHWYKEVMDNVFSYSSSLLKRLPRKLKMELEEVIVFVGEEIYSWNKFLLEKLRLDFDYAKVTYVSPFGAIDESQICRKYWLKNKASLKNNSFLDLACLFCEEKIISDLKYGIVDCIMKLISFFVDKKTAKKLIREIEMQMEEEADVVFILLTNWLDAHHKYLHSLTHDKRTAKMLSLRTGSFTSPSKENCKSMLRICCDLGYVHLFKYFFRKWPFRFDSDAKEFISLCKSEVKDEKRMLTDYEMKKYLEIIIILINGMSEPQKAFTVRNNYKVILKSTIRCWPYQEFFLKTVDTALQQIVERYGGHPWDIILHYITIQDEYDFDLGCPVQRNTYRSILKQASESTETGRPHSLIYQKKFYFDSLNVSTLKILCDFTEPSDVKIIVREILSWIKKDEFSKVDKFLEKGIETNEERELFKEKIKSYVMDELINEADYVRLDKFLPWFSVTFGVRTTKKDIDINQILVSLIDSEHVSFVNDFLKWLCDSEDEIMEVKKSLQSEEKSRYYIFRIFKSWSPCEMGKAEEFLNSIFNSEEEVKHFKLDVLLKDENSILEFALVRDNQRPSPEAGYKGKKNYFPIQKVIKFCGMREKKIDKLKRKCIDNIDKLMNEYTLKCKNFLVLHDMLKWLVKSAEGRQIIIKRFMNSPNAVVMCNKMLNFEYHVYGSLEDEIPKFYNKWVKYSDNIPQIKEQLIEMNSEQIKPDGYYMEGVSRMFSVLEDRNDIYHWEVVYFQSKHWSDLGTLYGGSSYYETESEISENSDWELDTFFK